MFSSFFIVRRNTAAKAEQSDPLKPKKAGSKINHVSSKNLRRFNDGRRTERDELSRILMISKWLNIQANENSLFDVCFPVAFS
jgi:hypothetical protein